MRHLTRKDLVVWFCCLWAWVAVLVCLAPQRLLAAEVIVAVQSVEAAPFADAWQGFKEALAKSGYQTAISEYTVQEGGRDEAKLLADIKQRRPALILTLGSAATTLMHRQVQDVPVVFCMVLNPVASGLVQSLQSSGNNLTGASLDISVRLQFETLQAVVPAVKKVGVLYNPQETGEVVRAAAQVAADIGLESSPSRSARRRSSRRPWTGIKSTSMPSGQWRIARFLPRTGRSSSCSAKPWNTGSPSWACPHPS